MAIEHTDGATYPLRFILDPPMSRRQVLSVALIGFGLVVGLVLLAAYLGYRGSENIQDAARTMVREHVLQTGRGAALEASIVRESQLLLNQLASILGLCFILAAGTAGLTVWIIERAFAKLEWQAAELAHVSWHMIDNHENLARRFSHEMHDELGQSLTGLRRILSRVGDGEFGTVRTDCIDIVDEVLESVRKLGQALRPVILDDFGLDSGLRWLCERFSERTQIAVRYDSNYSGRFTEATETHLFRIAQEALTNIARHSGATSASVTLDVSEARVDLTITDNGHGLKPGSDGKGQSLGMVGMRARARQVNGELFVENRKEGGLQILVRAPYSRPAANAQQEDSRVAR